MKNHSPYKKSKNLLTKTEADFYVYLKAAVNNDFHINKMTRMCDLVDVDKNLSNKEYMSHFRSISQYHIDFTLCDPFSFKPIICIELDDPSHERADRIKRDVKVNRIFTDINLPLLRIKTERTYNVENLRNLIDRNLNIDKKRSSAPQGHPLNYEATTDLDMANDQDGVAQKTARQDRNLKRLRVISSGLIVIFATVFIMVSVKDLATKLIPQPRVNAIKSDISKQSYPVPKEPVNPRNKRKTSALTTKKSKSQRSVLPSKNNYTLADISVTSSAGNRPANEGNATEKKEIKIRPNFYTGSFTVEMIWDGNYKSGNGIIALLNCGNKWLLLEQLESGIQLEQPVKKIAKETHTLLLPATKTASSYYTITSSGALQKWDSEGKVNEFNRRT